MTTIRCDGANFSVMTLEDDTGPSVLLSAWILPGTEKLQTKIGADFRLPPAEALLLAEAMAKEARMLIAQEVQNEQRTLLVEAA